MHCMMHKCIIMVKLGLGGNEKHAKYVKHVNLTKSGEIEKSMREITIFRNRGRNEMYCLSENRKILNFESMARKRKTAIRNFGGLKPKTFLGKGQVGEMVKLEKLSMESENFSEMGEI